MDPFLTTAETADRLRAPASTLRYWRHIGIGPRSAKIGRRVLYRESDVQKWIEQRFVESGTGGVPHGSA